MNAHSTISRKVALFRSNRSQAVRIPKDLEFPEGVKQVVIRKAGRGLEIIPVSEFWDNFFARPGIDIEEPTELPYEARDAF